MTMKTILGGMALVTVDVRLDSIKPYERNQKKHPESQINNIAKSIEKYGFVQPLVLDKNDCIIIGHGRYMAAEKLGMGSVPVVYAENLTEQQIRELRILDNKLNESEWDIDKLKLDLSDLDFGDFEDLNFDIDLDSDDEDLNDFNADDDTYTKKTEIPQYEVTGEVPKLNECAEKEKYDELIKAINESNVSDEEKAFLLMASARHIAFDYAKIAEYYAAASEDMQKLMEDNALVIIDYDDAIKKGYVLLDERMTRMLNDGKKE